MRQTIAQTRCYGSGVSRQQRRRFTFDSSQLRITRGALILIFIQVGVSLIWLMSDDATKHALARWLVATPEQVWREGKVWTLVTGPLLEVRFITLCLTVFVLWMFLPQLERFWGTKRFLRFAAMTAIAGAIGGTLMGLATGRDVPIVGFDSMIYAGIVAYGVIYARQPVQFFGVLPMTGRQLMYGILGFLILFVVLQQAWEDGAAYVAAIGLTALLLNKTWSPELWWQRWRRRRARKHLDVLQGGRGSSTGSGSKPEPPRWVN
jgi:membrane associated rhomboid family serine protease